MQKKKAKKHQDFSHTPRDCPAPWIRIACDGIKFCAFVTGAMIPEEPASMVRYRACRGEHARINGIRKPLQEDSINLLQRLLYMFPTYTM